MTLSTKKLITKTFTQTIDGAKYTTLLKRGTGTASKTSTAYTGGLKMTSGVERHRRGGLLVHRPERDQLQHGHVHGDRQGHDEHDDDRPPELDRLHHVLGQLRHRHPWRPALSAASTSASVSSPASTGLATAIRRVRGYIFAPALPGTVRTLDVRDVKVTVTYKVLG